MLEIIETMRWMLAMVMLIVVSIPDIKDRSVSNKPWVAFGAYAAILWVWEIVVDPTPALAAKFALAALSTILFVALWLARAFGGADAKALIVLAFLLPWRAPGQELVTSITPAIDALMNGLALFGLTIPVILFSNLLRGDFAGHLTFVAVRMPIEHARKRFVIPLAPIMGDGSPLKNNVAMQKLAVDEPDKYYDTVEHFAHVREVWAAPRVPLLPLIMLGLLFSAYKGNVFMVTGNGIRFALESFGVL